MLFSIVYILFVISSIFYGDLIVIGGFLTLRHITTILMFSLCFKEDKKVWTDKYFNLYILFVLFFLFSSLLTGYFGDALNFVFAFYFICYVAYWSTRILIEKRGDAKLLIYPLLLFGVFDAIVSINQVTGFLNLDSYITLLRFQLSDHYLEQLEYHSDFMGISVPGIMNHPVTNGDFLMVVSIISLYLQRNKLNIVGLVATCILIVGSFFTQQRSPFFIAILFILFVCYRIIYRRQKKIVKIMFLFPLLVFLFYGTDIFFDIVSSGSSRYIDTSMTGREKIYDLAWNFIKDNPLLGGYFFFNQTTHLAPHNFIFNAFIYGGLVGGIAIIYLVLKQIIAIIPNVFSKVSVLDSSKFVMGSAYLAILGNSMTHNTGIVSGSVLAWFLWGAFAASFQMNR